MTETAPRPKRPSEEAVEAALMQAVADAGKGRSVAPEEVARAVARSPEWQVALPVVRRVAVRLAKAGRLGLYRKGKPVDPDELRGVFRLGLPPSGDGEAPSGSGE